MKIIVPLFIILCQACATSEAQDVPFLRLGSAFLQTNINVVWNAPTNNLPKKVWVYRALPSKLSPKAISNLVTAGAFTDKDRKKIPDEPRLISYGSSDGKKALLINTEWTFIHYSDSKAKDFNITNGVPDRQRAFEMANNWLPKLGIDDRQLSKNSNDASTKFRGGPETVFLYPREGGPAYATNICLFNVTFFRALDGIEFSGGCARGGGEIEFAHDAKISSILISWRNYKRDKRYPAALPKTLLQWIHDGKAVWYPQIDSSLFDWNSVTEIVITNVTPLYYSEAYGENDKPQKWAVPFAELTARVKTSKGDSVVYFDCPILDKPTSY